MFKKIFILTLGISIFLTVNFVFAQDEQVTQQVSQEVVVTSTELGVSEPIILPDSPFYFIKNISRAVQSVFTFNAAKKAELSLKFANEKLLEAKKLTEKNASEEKINKAIDSYKAELEKVEARIENIKEKTPQIETFLNRFVDNGLKQQKIIDKINEKNENLSEKLERAKERGLEIITNVASSTIKSEETKSIKKEEVENLIKKFQATEEKFLSLINEKKISLDENKTLKSAYDLAKKHLENTKDALNKEKVGEAWGQIHAAINAIEKTISIFERKINVVKPTNIANPNKDVSENQKEAKCEPQKEACVQDYKPVCGVNGITYTNDCTARIKCIKIVHEGECGIKNPTTTDIKQIIPQKIAPFLPKTNTSQ